MREFHKTCGFWDQGVEGNWEWLQKWGAADVIAQLIIFTGSDLRI